MKLKKYIGLVAAVVLFGSCQGNKSATNGADEFTLEGKFNNASAKEVYLYELEGEQFVARDTAEISADGSFTFSGSITEPTLYRVALDQQNGLMLVLDKGKINVLADASNLNGSVKVEGSEESKLFQELNKLVNETQMQQQQLTQKYSELMQAGKTDSAEALRGEYMVLQSQIKNFLAKHPKSVVSAFGTATLVDPVSDFAFADSMATLYSQYIPNSQYTAMLNERLKEFRSTAVGQMAPDITLATPDGDTKSLSSLRGKYVLIDFWASWCGPCRQENPNVVRTYNKYKDKGFEIYGVSLDQSREKWLGAIEKDNLSWVHVSDLKGWESSAAQTYNVTAIPQTVLINPEGKIIAKGLRGEQLEEKLATLFN